MSAPVGLVSLSSAADAVAARLNSLGTLLDGAGKGLGAVSEVFIRAMGGALAALVNFPQTIKVMDTTMTAFGTAISDAWNSVRTFSWPGLVGILAGLGTTVIRLTENLATAFGAITTSFMRSIPAMVTAVAQLAPGLTNVLGQVFRDLQATVGQAFLPVIEVFIGVIDQIAGVLNPIMQKLAPVFAQLATAIGGILVAAVQVLAAVITAMMPSLRIVAAIFQAIAVVLQAFFTIIAAFVQSFGGFGDDFQDALDAFVDGAKWAAAQMILIAARIAAVFGATGFLKNLADMVGGQAEQGKGARAALQGGAVTDFAALTHAMAASSVAAFGAGGIKQKDEKEWLKQLHDDLLALMKDVEGFRDRFVAHIAKDVAGAAAAVPQPVGVGVWGVAADMAFRMIAGGK